MSRKGVQKGDPLGPFLFSLGIMDLMNSCTSEFNGWYLDDGTIAGDPKTVQDDLEKILQASESLGLQINSSKCEMYIIPHKAEGATGQPLHDETNAVLTKIMQIVPKLRH